MGGEITTIKDRILQIAKHKGVRLELFLQKIGMSYSSFKGESKKAPLNSGAVVSLVTKYPDISPDWLLTGRGPMFRDGGPTQETTPVTDPSDVGRETLYKELLVELKREITVRDEKIEKLNRQLGAAEAKLGEREARGFRPEDLGGVRPADFPYTTSGKNPYRK